jgi:hypothetical protein
MPVAESVGFGRDRVPIDGLARGIVRRFKAGLPEKLLERLLASAPFNRAVRAVLLKGTDLGRWRAASKVGKMYPDLRLEVVRRDLVVWSYLQAIDHLLVNPREPGEAQEAVMVKYMLASRVPDRTIALFSGLWTLEVPDHALGRLVMRSPGADLRAVIHEAHRWALRARVLSPLPPRDQTVLLPAGDGAFLSRVIAGRAEEDDEPLIYFRPRTWVPSSRLRADQRPLELGEPSLGASLLLPAPLRHIKVDGGYATVKPRQPT